MMSVTPPGSTSAAATDLGWNANPTAPNYSNEASLGLCQQSLLPQAWTGFNGTYNTTNSLDTSQANANAQGLGQATGLGLSQALGATKNSGTLGSLLNGNTTATNGTANGVSANGNAVIGGKQMSQAPSGDGNYVPDSSAMGSGTMAESDLAVV